MAVALSETGDGNRYVLFAPGATPGGAIRLPANGFANAHGLYQLSLVLVFVAQVIPGLEGSGDPPGAKGSPIMIALAWPPAAVLMFGETVKGVPDCAAKVRLVDQPPTARSAHLD